MNRLAASALAGLIATAPMTLVMTLGRRFLLPPNEQHAALPPREITLQAAEKAGVDTLRDLNESERRAATLVAHYGFGTVAGALYAAPLLAGRGPSPIPAATGAGWGLLVWAGSYLGWLPAANILPPATDQPARRTLLMIGAHLVWGAVLGVAAERLTQSGSANE